MENQKYELTYQPMVQKKKNVIVWNVFCFSEQIVMC